MSSLHLITKSTREILSVRGSLVFVKALKGAKYGEIVELEVEGDTRLGQIIDVSKDIAIVQIFGSSAGISPGKTVVRLRGEVLRLGVSADMLGRIFDGLGKPIDGGPSIVPEEYLDIHGEP
ncbi:MAG: V-type ATP synthase subunit B, partial [Desulfurococcaceae archaeon]